MTSIYTLADGPTGSGPLDVGTDSEARVRTQRLRVLVVDDERLIADTVAQILNFHGYDAFPAYNAPEALRLADGFRPHLLLSDVMMPGMNGIDLAHAVREMLPRVKVLLFSGQAGTNRVLSGKKLDFSLEEKPIHPTRLLKALEDLARGV